MTANFRGGAYDAGEANPYAVDAAAGNSSFRRGSYGSSMTPDFRPRIEPRTTRMAGQLMGGKDAREGDDGRIGPTLQGFRLSRDGQDAMSSSSDGLAQGMGPLTSSALRGQSNYIAATQEQQSTLRQARVMQQERQKQQQPAEGGRRRGGLLGAIGGIAGSLIGGPIGGIIGGVASLFG